MSRLSFTQFRDTRQRVSTLKTPMISVANRDRQRIKISRHFWVNYFFHAALLPFDLQKYLMTKMMYRIFQLVLQERALLSKLSVTFVKLSELLPIFIFKNNASNNSIAIKVQKLKQKYISSSFIHSSKIIPNLEIQITIVQLSNTQESSPKLDKSMNSALLFDLQVLYQFHFM